MTCACLFVGPSYLPVFWSCPLALPLGLPCFCGLPSGFAFFCLGLCPLGFLFAVLLVFAGLFALLVWSGRFPDATDRLFRFRVHGVLSLRAVAAAGCALVLRCCLFGGSSHQSSHARLNHAVRCLLGGS